MPNWTLVSIQASRVCKSGNCINILSVCLPQSYNQVGRYVAPVDGKIPFLEQNEQSHCELANLNWGHQIFFK